MSLTVKRVLGAVLLIATVGVASCQAFFADRGTVGGAEPFTTPHLQPGTDR
jgi:hypothetical protein